MTQAATKADRCCVVASLLTSEPTAEDELGRKIKGQIYDIFQRQREEAVEPVIKEDIAEVLRRRFFKPESLKDRESFRQHVMAALKGVQAVDEQTAKHGPEAEERFLRSYPFHPDLTEVLYSNGHSLTAFSAHAACCGRLPLLFERRRSGHKFAYRPPSSLALRKRRTFGSPAGNGRVADTEEWEGKKQAWTGILDGSFRAPADPKGIRRSEIP